MAVHIEEIIENAGMVKEIDEGAMSMLYDNLQRSQYQYPMKSTVRELVSNGIDSINEKNIALAILDGRAKVEDHYYMGGNAEMDETLTKNSGVYKDSKFIPEYYDPAWLDLKNQGVEVIYQERGPLERDLLIIKDSGVGLGGSRLEGYFKLGYSSKRLAKRPLGKYGLGSKVALSTGVKYYTVISRYNGEESHWNVYSANIESLTPPFEMGTGEQHVEHVTSKGYKYFTKRTAQLNGLEIQIDVKKHMKQEIINAVKNQLLYFPMVSLSVHYLTGDIQEIPVQAEILYEDDKIIISDNDQFSKPHILVNGISYGYIDFLELELEEKGGNIGIKVEPNEIEVVPSRESVVWNEITGETVRERFKGVVDIASKFVQDQLIETDFMKWLKLCSFALSGSTSGDDKRAKVLKTLSQVADISDLKPSFNGDNTLKYSPNFKTLMPEVTVIRVTKDEVIKGGETLYKVTRTKISNVSSLDNVPIFIKETKSSFRKDMYMLNVYPSGFITIQEAKFEDSWLASMEALAAQRELERQAALAAGATLNLAEVLTGIDNDRVTDEKSNKVLELIRASEGVISYETVEVPESFSTKEPTAEEEDNEETLVTKDNKVKVSAKDRRKLEGKVVAHTLRYQNPGFTNQKLELKTQDLDKMNDLEMYYSAQDYDKLLELAACISEPLGDEMDSSMSYVQRYCRVWERGSKVRLLKVAKSNERYFSEAANHITFFYSRFNNGTITMSNILIKWNTARLVDKHLSKLAFLANYSSINREIAASFSKLRQYHVDNFRNTGNIGDDIIQSLVGHLDKVTEMQLFIASNPSDTSGIAEMAVSLFPEDTNAASITGAVGYDLEIYNELHALLDYAEPIHTMLNMIGTLQSPGSRLSLAQEQVIKSYVDERTQ